ncbi:hypothetical protein CXB51_008575 [Gossypium anomalum]|uniref:DUF7745 domain-containing protein n=1 Tax=Gossypium anomalum TaxID=47600 RepID=A0A8J6D837_9ROSI|nr:hypothetical protein CXB51_008575 [Gossypium anomalum]
MFPFAKIPQSCQDMKRLIKDLGLGYDKIHSCLNDCMLYWGDQKNQQSCNVCGKSRWMNENIEYVNADEGGAQLIKKPVKVLRYFSPIPRLQRLFMSSKTAESMRWHNDQRIDDGLLRHPADSLAWKSFDSKFPIACSLQFSSMDCMKQSSFILSMIIPGEKGPENDIDIYLQPLIEELKQLWSGVETYDVRVLKDVMLVLVVLRKLVRSGCIMGRSSLTWAIVGEYRGAPEQTVGSEILLMLKDINFSYGKMNQPPNTQTKRRSRDESDDESDDEDDKSALTCWFVISLGVRSYAFVRFSPSYELVDCFRDTVSIHGSISELESFVMRNEYLNKVEDNASVCTWSEKTQLEKGDSVIEGYTSELWDFTHIKVDKHLLRAMVQFWNPAYSCFTFGDVDLVPTLEEYTTLLRCPRIQGYKAYVRPASLPTFTKMLVMITGMNVKKRVDVLVLSIYGMVIFPKALGHIDEAKLDKVPCRVFFEGYSSLKKAVDMPRRDDISDESFDWVSLPGIWGVVGYTPLLVLRQYRARQFIPATQGLVQSDFSYKGDHYKKRMREIFEAWKKPFCIKILTEVNL